MQGLNIFLGVYILNGNNYDRYRYKINFVEYTVEFFGDYQADLTARTNRFKLKK